MSRQWAALALAVLLIASVFVGLGVVSGTHGPAAEPLAPAATSVAAASHPDAGPISISPYNGYGDPTDEFCIGACLALDGNEPGASTIYFSIGDTMADLAVNVTINDPNATRDGLVNPVFSAALAINQTTHENLTPNDNHLSFTFPGALPYGGGWNITASAPLGGFTAVNLTLYTYSMLVAGNPDTYSVVVPGEPITLSWIATDYGTGAAYSDLTSVTANGEYTNATPLDLFSPGLLPLPVKGTGSFTFAVPANATPDTELSVSIWAVTNVSGQVAENESENVVFYVGALEIQRVTLNSSPGCQLGGGSYDTFTSGSPVFVCVWVEAHGSGRTTTDIPGMTVSFLYWNGLENVTPGGSPPASVTTNSTGPVAISFVPSAPPFTSYYSYPFSGNSINITVSDPAAIVGYANAYENLSFQVLPPSGAGVVSVALNSYLYVAGQTVFVNWTLAVSNASVGVLHAVQWGLSAGTGLASTGAINSTASSGMLELSLPAGYIGGFYVYVVASNGSALFEGAAIGEVALPTLLVSTPSPYFTGGQTISFPVELSPSAEPGTTIYYNITGYWISYPADFETAESVVAVGTVANNGAISFAAPSNNPATYYTVDVWAQSPVNGVYATGSAESDLETGFAVLVGISTLSSYSDGSFQPGQTIQVTWSLSPYGNQPLPGQYTLYLYLGDTLVEPVWTSTASSGTIALTIPSNTPSGLLYLDLYVYAPGVFGPECDSYYSECYGESGLTVNAHPSVLNMELGAGSGLTVGWLILLIVILVVAVLLVLLMRRRPPMTARGPTYSPTTGSIPPAAPPPSTAPAAEWKDPSASSPPPSSTTEMPPPLPTPPAGPQ